MKWNHLRIQGKKETKNYYFIFLVMMQKCIKRKTILSSVWFLTRLVCTFCLLSKNKIEKFASIPRNPEFWQFFRARENWWGEGQIFCIVFCPIHENGFLLFHEGREFIRETTSCRSDPRMKRIKGKYLEMILFDLHYHNK